MQRDPIAIQAALYESNEHKLYCKKPLILEFPKRFVDRGMAHIGIETDVYGIFALHDEVHYSVSLVPSMINTSPEQIRIVERSDEPYYQFLYSEGSCVIDNTMLVRKDTLVYNIMEEFFLKGNVPWYVSYDDLGRIFDNAKTYADSDVAQNYAIMEALAAYIARDPKDKAIQYRLTHKDKASLKESPVYIGLFGNVFYAAPGTVAKLAGSYFQDAVVSALVQPESKATHLEKLLLA